MVGEGIVIIVVVFLAVSVAIAAVVGKVFFAVVAGTFRMLLGGPPPEQFRLPGREQQCLRDGCGARNPMEARFCRRCGHRLVVERQAARRAAVW